jgi:hypothetical protein
LRRIEQQGGRLRRLRFPRRRARSTTCALCGELQIATVRQQLSFSLFTDFENFAAFTPASLHNDAAVTLFDQLECWAGALKPLRG